jgi:NAD(P)-dependent dehydrogenase (short-subunit alcohol dehydrogenase family)
VLITGGSSGIGLACARRLRDAGAHVALLARDHGELERARAQLGHLPPTLTADVADPQAMQRAVDEAVARLGGLDAVVANAGAAVYGPFQDATPADFERTVRTTLLGVLITAHAALPHLERAHGTLIVTGSIAGRVPTPWLAAYSASKHGVRGFVRSLHAELRALGSSVQIALVAPGPVDTPFWRRARTTDRRLPPRVVGAYRPEDVAREVERALAHPRPERAVGGLMAAWAFCDAIAPRVSLAVTARLARLGWRRRGRRPSSRADALHAPGGPSSAHSDLPSRPSLLGAARDRLGTRPDA